MKIYIMRHGEAEDAVSFTQNADAQRALTKIGIKDAGTMGKYLAGINCNVRQLFISPYRRAQQTSIEVLKNQICVDEIKCTTLDFITPSGKANIMHDYLDGFISTTGALKDGGDIVIISHMPFVSYLVEQLTVSSEMPMFSTASIVEIDYDIQTMKGVYLGMTTPEQLALN